MIHLHKHSVNHSRERESDVLIGSVGRPRPKPGGGNWPRTANATLVHRMFIPILLIFFFSAASVFASTNLLENAVAKATSDISAATQELNALRDEIGAQKIPRAREMESLNSEVRALRETVALERATRNMRSDVLVGLRKGVLALEGDFQFIHTILVEYRRSIETYAGAAEAQILIPQLEETDRAFSTEESPTATADGGEKILGLAQSWSRAGFFVRTNAGICLDTQGRKHSGNFVVVGPLEYFSSPEAVGLVIVRAGSSLPSVFDNLPDGDLNAITKLADTGEACVPVDVSSGNAIKARKARKSISEHIKAGGFTMYPLLAIGILSLVLSIWKFISLSAVCTSAPAEISRITSDLNSKRIENAQNIAESLGAPLRSIIIEGINHCNASSGLCEEIMHERVLTAVPALRSYLGALAVFGAVSPLLGLLGTVTGMIHVFQRVTIFGTGDARMLSGGISEALVTTVTGLAIAIPVLLVHAYLSRKVSSMTGELEHSVVEFVHNLNSQNGDWEDDHTRSID